LSTNINPILNGIVGGWEFTGAGRIQALTLNLSSRSTRSCAQH